MKVITLSLITALVALASGCTTEPTTDAEPSEHAAPEPPVAPAAPRPEVTILPIEMVVAVGVYDPHPVKIQPQPVNGGRYEVGDADSILVEAMWACQSPTCTMRIDANSPEGHVAQGVGEGQIRLPIDELGGPWEDTWQVAVFADGAAAVIEGEIRISVFEHGPVPDDYSAF